MAIRTLLILACPAVLLGGYSCSTAEEPADVEETLAAQGSSCNAPLGWWESPGLEPLFQTENGPSPTGCDFHVWSWTSFVHWTQIDPATGQPLFLGLPTPAQLGPSATAHDGKLRLQPRDLKPEKTGEINQAGSNGVLVDQHARVVYYSSHMDPLYFSTVEKYYGKEKYKNASPTTDFPIGATVFKASWRIVQAGEDTSGIYTTLADLALLTNKDGSATATSEYMKDVEVALMGLHVVGVIKDHPEFAWATFEHPSNSPALPKGADPKGNEVVSQKNFALYKAGTVAADCNQQANVTVENLATQQSTPITNVYLQYLYGGANLEQTSYIQQTNQSFQQGLLSHAGNNKNLNPVFADYFLVGTVWQQPNSLKPGDGNMSATSVGSVKLANSTMETFVQGKTDCFSCHNTAGNSSAGYPGKNINLSHVVLGPFFGD